MPRRAVLALLLAAGVAAMLAESGRLGLVLPVAAAEAAGAAAATAAPVASGSLSELLADDGFVYRQEGRPDPFLPFVSTAVKPGDKQGEEELTGMRKFEPGQLLLVAIVFTGNEPLAMVQDSVGKGYMVRKGTRIGRSGIVREIVPNRVVIDNISHTLAGEERITTVEMLLKQKGEEKQ